MQNGILKNTGLMTIFFSIVFFICSCQNEEIGVSQATMVSESEADLEMVFNAVNAITSAAMKYATEQTTAQRTAQNGELACAAVEFEGTEKIGKIVIDFGTQGCRGKDGLRRRGKIIVEYNGKQIYYGSLIYTTFVDFYLDKYKVEGTIKSENISDRAEKQFNISVSDGKLIFPDQTYATWQTERVHTWIDSAGHNGVLSVTGTSKGLTNTGKAYSTFIEEPLIINLACAESGNYTPVQGIKSIVLNTEEKSLIDYGTGNCDRQYTITTEEVSQETDNNNL